MTDGVLDVDPSVDFEEVAVTMIDCADKEVSVLVAVGLIV